MKSENLIMMDALLWDGTPYPEGLIWGKIPKPQAQPGWLVIENRATGICGSDLHYLSGAMRHQVPDNNLPAVLGHENAGVVVGVGQGVKGFQVGDRVVAEPLHPCIPQGLPPCPACRVGQYHLCANLGHVGIPAKFHFPGGFGAYSTYHNSALFHLPDHVSFEEASLIDVLACGVHALHLGIPCPGDATVVLGCGAIGLDMIQCLRTAGVINIVAIARYTFQAKIAQQYGAKEVICLEDETDPVLKVLHLTGGADRVFECVGGEADTVQQAIDMCRPGAQIVMLGFFSGMRSINLCTLFLKELDIQASDGYSTWGQHREFEIALQMVASGKVDHTSLITHRIARADWDDALKVAFNKHKYQCIKVVLTAT